MFSTYHYYYYYFPYILLLFHIAATSIDRMTPPPLQVGIIERYSGRDAVEGMLEAVRRQLCLPPHAAFSVVSGAACVDAGGWTNPCLGGWL